MEFTHKNHLQYSIGGRVMGWRESPFERYTVTMGAIDRDYYRTTNWLEEQYRTARLVTDNWGQEFALFYSGGTDSEIVLRVLLAIGRRPQIFFIRFTGGQNSGDYKTAVEVTTELGVPLRVIDVDIVDYYRSGRAGELGSKIQAHQIAYLNVLEQIRAVGLPAIMGGELYLRRRPTDSGSEWYYCFRENEDASVVRFSQYTGIPVVNEWFSYTPESVACWIENPHIHELVTTRFNYKLSTVSTKNKVLGELLPQIRAITKSHGFEQLLNFNTESYYNLKRGYTPRLTPCLDGIPLDQCRIQLGLEQ